MEETIKKISQEIYKAEQREDKWERLLVLSDLLEESGKTAEAAACRWMAKRKKYPRREGIYSRRWFLSISNITINVYYRIPKGIWINLEGNLQGGRRYYGSQSAAVTSLIKAYIQILDDIKV